MIFVSVAKGRSLFNRMFSNILERVGSKLIGRYEVTFSGGLFGFGINIISENFQVRG